MQRYRDGSAWQDEAGYVRGIRVRNRIEISGTTASAPDGSALFPSDAYGQTLDALGKSMTAVVALGGAATDVIRTRLFLAPGANWREAARAHREIFGEHPPANTTLFVAGLVGEGLLVEVEVCAQLSGELSAGAAAEQVT